METQKHCENISIDKQWVSGFIYIFTLSTFTSLSNFDTFVSIVTPLTTSLDCIRFDWNDMWKKLPPSPLYPLLQYTQVFV